MTMTQDERISRLEVAFEVLSVVAANMVTKDELRSAIDGQKEATQAQMQGLRSEMRSEIKAAELRTIRWMVATAFAVATLAVGAMSAIVVTALRVFS